MSKQKEKEKAGTGNKLTPNKFDFSSMFSEDKVEPPEDDEDKDKKEP